jgi:hypothetical protein
MNFFFLLLFNIWPANARERLVNMPRVQKSLYSLQMSRLIHVAAASIVNGELLLSLSGANDALDVWNSSQWRSARTAKIKHLRCSARQFVRCLPSAGTSFVACRVRGAQ